MEEDFKLTRLPHENQELNEGLQTDDRNSFALTIIPPGLILLLVIWCGLSNRVLNSELNWTELLFKFLITRFGMWWIYFRYDKVLRFLNKRKSDLICIDRFFVLQKTFSSASLDHFQINRSMRTNIAIWRLEDIQILSVSLHRSSCSCNW